MTDENILSKLGSELKPYEGTDPLPQDLGKDSKEAFKQIVRARRSIRLFDGEKIPDEVMDSIFSDVTLSPTSSNLQPWQFYWIRDTDKKKRAAEACLGQPAATSASELIMAHNYLLTTLAQTMGLNRDYIGYSDFRGILPLT